MTPAQQAVLDACALVHEGKFAEAMIKIIPVVAPSCWDPRDDPVVADQYVKAFDIRALLDWAFSPEGELLIDELHRVERLTDEKTKK